MAEKEPKQSFVMAYIGTFLPYPIEMKFHTRHGSGLRNRKRLSTAIIADLKPVFNLIFLSKTK